MIWFVRDFSFCNSFLWRGPGSELRRPHGPLQTSPSLADAFILQGILFFACDSCHSQALKYFLRSLNVSLPRATLALNEA